MLLATHTYNRPASPDLTAVGLRRDGVEVLCAIDDDAEDSERRRDALERSLAPDSFDPLTREPISDAFANSEISSQTDGDLSVLKAEVEPAAGTAPGVLFKVLVRGSALVYLGVPRPVERGTATRG
jgi:hypothetical protein